MLLDKAALELLYRKCLAYIDEKISSIVELAHQSMVGGSYVKMFDRQRLNETMGSSFLTVGKFREFLDWLANVFGFYDKEIEDIKNDIDELEEKVDAIDTSDIKAQNYINITGIFGDGVESVDTSNNLFNIKAVRGKSIFVFFDAIRNGLSLSSRYDMEVVSIDGQNKNRKSRIVNDGNGFGLPDNVNAELCSNNFVAASSSNMNHVLKIVVGNSYDGTGFGFRVGFTDRTDYYPYIYIKVDELAVDEETNEPIVPTVDPNKLTWEDGNTTATIKADSFDYVYPCKKATELNFGL